MCKINCSGGCRECDPESHLVALEGEFLELSQLASKLFKMSTYRLLSPEERKRFNELTEGCNDD